MTMNKREELLWASWEWAVEHAQVKWLAWSKEMALIKFYRINTAQLKVR